MRQKRPAYSIALCGLLAAMAVAVMALGTMIPVGTFCCPALSGLLMIPVLDLCGAGAALCWYGAVGLLSLVLAPDREGRIIPKIKISENVEKITNPHFKRLYRLYGKESGKAEADYLCVYDETVDDGKPLRLFDPEATWKEKTLTDFVAKELQVPIFKDGKQVYQCPSLDEIRTYCMEQVDSLWDEVKRFDNPHNYYVDLSQKLWDIKQDLLLQQER